MRVAQVLGTATTGIGRHVLSLVRGLIEGGDRVDVYCPPATAERFRFGEAGARVVPLDFGGAPGPRDLGGAGQLRRALRDDPVDVVHAHGLRAGFVAGFVTGASRPAGIPLVVTWHTSLTDPGLRGAAARALARSVAGAADLTLAASTELVAAAVRLGARQARRCQIVAPRLPAPTRSAAEVRDELGLADGSPLVLSVGRLDERHRHDVLIAAAARWRPLRPAPTAVIAGTGPAFRELTGQIVLARAPVILLGHRDDLGDLLPAADVAVVTGTAAASPQFVQEALAAGVPLVTAELGGVAELVGPAATLVPPGSVDALDAAVRTLLADPDRAARGRAGRDRAAGWPSEADTVAEVLASYRALAPTRPPARDAPGELR
jgi:glycosyltransferase involved in cell wall biosynthesis